MNDLEMCKAIAKLEGVELYRDDIKLKELNEICSLLGNDTSKEEFCDGLKQHAPSYRFNPITDLALNCMLRDKYEVQVDYRDRDITVWENDEATTSQSTRFESKGDIPRAVCLCILKSKGVI